MEQACTSSQPLNLETRQEFVNEWQDDSLVTVREGGICSAKGFSAAGIHAGFRADPERLDMALVVADAAVPCAGVFTQNVFCAAPVSVCREQLNAASHEGAAWGKARALVINSGNANAATGEAGLISAYKTVQLVADALDCDPREALVASTGVIGVPLDTTPFEEALPSAVAALSAAGASDAAKAIMTTDTHSKEAAVCFSGEAIGYPGCVFHVGGMAKGSGMIMPTMATMIACITTDAPLMPQDLHRALKRAVDVSFNKITVDSDTSTNDSCFLFASGAAAPDSKPFTSQTPAYTAFENALQAVCIRLARAMAADGEGASRLVTVRVAGAATADDADKAARAVANSPLVKTAISGHDANWGRIAAALGKSGATFSQETVAIDIMGLPVLRNGLPVVFDEDEALRRFERSEISIDVDLGAGTQATTLWTCDFTHDYITINGDYRT